MAKVNPIDGKIRGKLGGRVYSLRSGETIIRELNPAPYNPNTKSQVETRAKLKLLSQLSAVCAPVIAIPREGNKSARNLFTRENYSLLTYTSDNETATASIDLNKVQLTSSAVGLPPLTSEVLGNDLTVGLTATAGAGVDQVLYAFFIKGADQKIRYAGSQLAQTPGVGDTFSTTFDLAGSRVPVVILAYGIRFNTEDARSKFGSMAVPNAEDLAKLVVSRVLSPSDITLTETKGETVTTFA